ncbi:MULTISPECIES: hypothetical protein [Sphingomonas]|uniref:hypothetical protein n=1 Tax=Sphingomonas TaxID=13687 RepID=UPI00092799EB|nr:MULTISPECIES: hypothetical protein [unclassified Sphingomonas]MCW6529639.1 hypothetical protein [Sphingomonas lycopersici]OJU20001.1 MAG: hypothetical protein BGN95_21480 [Sphingomonas sp. 66-10]
MPPSAPAPDRFTRFVAIDWSGAKGARHRGIAVAECGAGDAAPVLVEPAGRIWSRSAVLDWLLARADAPLLVGFDFSFSAPFVARGAHLPGETDTADARALWHYVDTHSDDADLGAASFLAARRGRHFYLGAADGAKRDFLHWRVCETGADQSTKPSTVYDAIGAAQVAKASFAGMRLLHRLNERIAIWPFDPVPATGATVVEIYTAIAARAAGLRKGISKLRTAEALDAALAALGARPHLPLARYDDHATDAILAAAWLRRSAGNADFWRPARMTPPIAQSEGWTFGVL